MPNPISAEVYAGPSVTAPVRRVVLAEGELPSWVARWCRATGRTVAAEPMPGKESPDASGAVARAMRSAHHAEAVLCVRGVLREQRRVVAALQALPEDATALAAAAQCAAAMGADLTVVHAVPTSFGEHSVGMSTALERGRRLLVEAHVRAQRAAPGIRVSERLVRAYPYEVVGERLDADLLVLGGVRPGAESGLGLVALSALHHTPSSVLLVARSRQLHGPSLW